MASDSTIGSGTFVRGNIRGEGDLEVHGRVEGSVAITGELLIAETAIIRSDVTARRVVVRGAVLGNISADEAIVLDAGARVVGDLGAPQVGIRPGGLVRGNVSTEGPLSSAAITAEPTTLAKGRPSPKAASVPIAPIGRAAAPAARTPARPAAPVRAPARPAPPPPARAAAPAPHAARPLPPPVPPPLRTPEPPPPAHAAPHEPPPATAPAEAADHDDDVTGLSEPDASAGPPPPVVPALRKGAKASLRRKGAR